MHLFQRTCKWLITGLIIKSCLQKSPSRNPHNSASYNLWFSLNSITFFSVWNNEREKICDSVCVCVCVRNGKNVTISKDTTWETFTVNTLPFWLRKKEKKISFLLNWTFLLFLFLLFWSFQFGTQWSLSTMSVKMFLSPCGITPTHPHTRAQYLLLSLQIRFTLILKYFTEFLWASPHTKFTSFLPLSEL